MKILLIRHGDPDYEHDTLTPAGHREAALLAERISRMDIRDFYVSSLGRARDTAQYTLDKMGRTATVCEWMQEFRGTCVRPDRGYNTLSWDWLPEDWTAEPDYYDKDRWYLPKTMADSNTKQEYDVVADNLDRLLAQYGYVRDGNIYRAVQPNNDTIALFCHYGVGCVMISHLIGVSPMVLWHGIVAAPTSVTTIITEERRPGIASFRVNGYGDISHLYAAGVEPSFSGRFCECYDNKDERHD